MRCIGNNYISGIHAQPLPGLGQKKSRLLLADWLILQRLRFDSPIRGRLATIGYTATHASVAWLA